jgi:hypothetical protein
MAAFSSSSKSALVHNPEEKNIDSQPDTAIEWRHNAESVKTHRYR